MTTPEISASHGAPGEGLAAAAAMAGAVGSMVEQVVEASSWARADIVGRMGVSAGRLSQIAHGDGNLRMSTLGRLLFAAGFQASVTARTPEGETEIVVPRVSRRRRDGGEEASAKAVSDEAAPGPGRSESSSAEKAAAALCGAVGSLIEQMIEVCGYKKGDVAARMGVTPARLSQILGGDGNVRVSSLARVAQACGFSLQLTGRDTERGVVITVPRAGRRRQRVAADAPGDVVDLVTVRKRMEEIAPVQELVARGLLPSEVKAQPAALCALYEIADLNHQPRFLAAARRHNTQETPTKIQMAWLACASRAAKAKNAREFDADALATLAGGLSRRIGSADDFASLPAVFGEVGVRLVYVEQFPSGKISGASFALENDPTRPVIALSGRRGRLDMVLFTLLHECAHVVKEHVGSGTVVDELTTSDDPYEAQADALAAAWILPDSLEPPRTVTREWVEAEATRQRVHRLVIVGRLQFDQRLKWNSPLSKPDVQVKNALGQW